MALESYFDGSYIGKRWDEGACVTLAGFAAEDSIWSELDQQWERILNDDSRKPKAPYIHMQEAVAQEKEFSWRNGWNLQRVGFLVTDLLMYLQTLDKKKFRQFACTVDLKAYARLQAEGHQLENPIAICNQYCPTKVRVVQPNSLIGLG